ncbi:hypothetical protein EK21DRAFT_68732 [Setomelanomma holmii]|uniref:F-box domain-containing protein n=1 Tax=Setomelanomma holmii TaxID=210430 RepID=A0A9P4LL73_9PLEO|nr:hypothetical protein EK21DRAFT_68732 [Setomelanomma holmii]
MSQHARICTLPREIRDEILSYLIQPSFVYTSSDKPNTSNLHRTKVDAKSYVDTRIYLAARIAPNVLGICRQLREECLYFHNHIVAACASAPPTLPLSKPDPAKRPPSNILAERVGAEVDEEAERLHDTGVRITLEAQRQQRGQWGYAVPIREELSPRFLALLPLMLHTRKVRLVVWPGFDWWYGARPRATRLVNGRPRIDESAPLKPDAVSFAVGKVLEQLPGVEELEIDVLAHVGEFSRWNLPHVLWENVRYWVDGPVSRDGGQRLKKVKRRMAAVWHATLIEPFFEQDEVKVEENAKWYVKRKSDMRTPMVVVMADPGELDDYPDPIDEEFDRI